MHSLCVSTRLFAFLIFVDVRVKACSIRNISMKEMLFNWISLFILQWKKSSSSFFHACQSESWQWVFIQEVSEKMLNNNSNNAHLHTHINPSRSSFIENLLWFLWVSTAIMHRDRSFFRQCWFMSGWMNSIFNRITSYDAHCTRIVKERISW